jgi:hypothetical protein
MGTKNFMDLEIGLREIISKRMKRHIYHTRYSSNISLVN